MIWTKRILLALPFVAAAVLTVLINGADEPTNSTCAVSTLPDTAFYLLHRGLGC
jgi:hypothetical protein